LIDGNHSRSDSLKNEQTPKSDRLYSGKAIGEKVQKRQIFRTFKNIFIFLACFFHVLSLGKTHFKF